MTDDQTSPVRHAETLTAYQEGAVVSKMLLKKPGGNATLFAFAEGEGLSEHTAPFDALVYLVDGQAEIRLGGAVHRLGAGDTIVLPAGIPHAVHAASNFRMLLVMIKA